ncbi:MAG: hypothetical protein HRT35_19350 [Algicola sp.]|nr:hypothetical protein [Algicola sp.]
MVRYLLWLMMAVSFYTQACGDESKGPKLNPFALINQEFARDGLQNFEIYVAQKHKGYYLTYFEIKLPGTLSVGAVFSEGFGYEGYYSAPVLLNERSVKQLEIILHYSTTADKKGMVMCGNSVDLSLRDLLDAKRPKWVEPLPPPAPESESQSN